MNDGPSQPWASAPVASAKEPSIMYRIKRGHDIGDHTSTLVERLEQLANRVTGVGQPPSPPASPTSTADGLLPSLDRVFDRYGEYNERITTALDRLTEIL